MSAHQTTGWQAADPWRSLGKLTYGETRNSGVYISISKISCVLELNQNMKLNDEMDFLRKYL